MNDGSIICDKSIISEKFNEFFIGIGPSLAKKIPKQSLSPLHYLGNPMVQSIVLTEVTANEINKIIQCLKNGAAGHDDITASSLKLVSVAINQPLAYLCNLSFTQGTFPQQLKLANVLPLYKADDPYSFNNYRPVSLLCVLLNVFEKVMYDRLLEFLENHKSLFSGQFGFRRLHFIFSFHFNSLFGHLVPYKHQRQVPNILEIIHVATLVRAHTRAHTHTYTHTYTHMTVSAIVAGIDITQCTCNKVSYYDVHTLYIIHSTSSRVNSDISQYCSRILSNECSKWPVPSFS